jgi:hypothetical protein
MQYLAAQFGTSACCFVGRSALASHRLRVFENRMLRKIRRPKGDDITREWRRLHNEELHDRYASPNIIQVI